MKQERTSVPGIYKRQGKYVVRYRVGGKRYAETVPTMTEARRVKRERERAKDRGESELDAQGRKPFADYAHAWIESYQGITPETRREYARDLDRAVDFLVGKSLAGVNPQDVARFVAHLCDKGLADGSVRRIVAPLRACLSTARAHGLVRQNAADAVKLPRREQDVSEDGDKARALSREQLDAILRVVRPEYQALLRLLAATGLRWGEAVALRRCDLVLDGSSPCVQVRRSVRHGRFKPPKSRHGIRDVPLSPALVAVLRRHLAKLRPDGPDSLAFPSSTGTPLQYPNVLRRVLRPAAEEAGAAWAGFHTFRHTFASLHVASGTNIVTLSRLLGHHSPDFTLRRYAHLIPGDEVPCLDLDAELGSVAESILSPDPTGTDGTQRDAEPADRAYFQTVGG
jgi:integrase